TNSRGFDVLDRKYATLVFGTSTPSSKHLIATNTCIVPSAKDFNICSLSLFETVQSNLCKRKPSSLSNFVRILTCFSAQYTRVHFIYFIFLLLYKLINLLILSYSLSFINPCR